MKPLDQINWASLENPRGLWAFCVVCNKDIRELRTRKNTCSEACRLKKQHDIDQKSYANQMAKDPLYAQKQSAKQYSRIKADPEKLAKHQADQRIRYQMPNYKESLQVSQKKYKAKNRSKETERMRTYRDENPEVIAEIESKRVSKRSAERLHLKLEEPEKYQALLASEREAALERKSAKRLADLQKDLTKLVDKDE